MKIYCDDLSVFDSESEFRELERLLLRIRLDFHDLILDNPESFYETPFFKRAVAITAQVEVRELLSRQEPALADRGLDPARRARGPRAELVPVATADRACVRDPHTQSPVWYIDPATAGQWADSPLRLILENESDFKVLVKTAARIYDRHRVIKDQERGAIDLVCRGGTGEIKKFVKNSKLSERIFVLMDSDRTSAAAPEGNCQKKVREEAARRPHINAFILRKRELENYVPAEVWRHVIPNGHKNTDSQKEDLRKRRRWEKLSDEEKDFADLEKYFAKAKQDAALMNNSTLVPNAATLEARTGTELVDLLDEMEAWL